MRGKAPVGLPQPGRDQPKPPPPPPALSLPSSLSLCPSLSALCPCFSLQYAPSRPTVSPSPAPSLFLSVPPSCPLSCCRCCKSPCERQSRGSAPTAAPSPRYAVLLRDPANLDPLSVVDTRHTTGIEGCESSDNFSPIAGRKSYRGGGGGGGDGLRMMEAASEAREPRVQCTHHPGARRTPGPHAWCTQRVRAPHGQGD